MRQLLVPQFTSSSITQFQSGERHGYHSLAVTIAKALRDPERLDVFLDVDLLVYTIYANIPRFAMFTPAPTFHILQPTVRSGNLLIRPWKGNGR